LSIAGDGTLWTLDNDFDASYAVLLHYAADADGNVKPLNVIGGSKADLSEADGVAVTNDGKHVWAAHIGNNGLGTLPSLKEFSAKANGNVAPIREISGANTGLDHPGGLVTDVSGNVTVASSPQTGSADAMLTFGPTQHGNVAPLRTIRGATTGLSNVVATTGDATGRLWSISTGNTTMSRFGADARGDVKPDRKLYTMTAQNAMTTYSFSPDAPAAPVVKRAKHHKLVVKWKKPKTTGGAVLGYILLEKTPGGKFGVVNLTAKHSVTTKKLKAGKKYAFKVAAYNAIGLSSYSKRGSGKPR
jgi:hypothetical protein